MSHCKTCGAKTFEICTVKAGFFLVGGFIAALFWVFVL